MSAVESPTTFKFTLLTPGQRPGWATVFDPNGVDRMKGKVGHKKPLYAGMSVTAHFRSPPVRMELAGATLYSDEGEVMASGMFGVRIVYAPMDTLDVTFMPASFV